jgi:hypothetical protein
MGGSDGGLLGETLKNGIMSGILGGFAGTMQAIWNDVPSQKGVHASFGSVCCDEPNYWETLRL